MRGITLAIETIIVVILAVSVLTILLFFFRSNYSDAETTVALINKQSTGCTGYIFYDPECDAQDIRNGLDTEILDKIATACSGLNKIRGDYASCAGKTTLSLPGDAACVQDCCRNFCGGR